MDNAISIQHHWHHAMLGHSQEEVIWRGRTQHLKRVIHLEIKQSEHCLERLLRCDLRPRSCKLEEDCEILVFRLPLLYVRQALDEAFVGLVAPAP